MHLLDLRAANVARDREWVSPGAGQALSLSFRGNELAGEIGEACNVLKKLERERLGLVGSRATLDDLAEELADGVICIDLIAMDTGIDLGPAVERKFNKTSVARGLATRLMTSAAIRDVVAERRRHVEVEGWTATHDDEHDDGEMARAAACYAIAGGSDDFTRDGRNPADPPNVKLRREYENFRFTRLRELWPWGWSWWKPKNRRYDLVRAAALLIAEIERIDRRDGAPQ